MTYDFNLDNKDVIGNFNKDYVKTGIFPREIGRKISEAGEMFQSP